MAATSWAPINNDKYISAYVVSGRLDGWFQQKLFPVSETVLSSWFMDEVGYIRPPEPVVGSPFVRPEYGQGWPVWAAAPVQLDVGLEIVRISQAEYDVLDVKNKSTVYVLEG